LLAETLPEVENEPIDVFDHEPLDKFVVVPAPRYEEELYPE
jgi:hypothetical protein